MYQIGAGYPSVTGVLGSVCVTVLGEVLSTALAAIHAYHGLRL